MKFIYETRYKNSIKVTEDNLIKLNDLLSKHFSDIVYKVELENNDVINFNSFKMLQQYKNLASNKMKCLIITINRDNYIAFEEKNFHPKNRIGLIKKLKIAFKDISEKKSKFWIEKIKERPLFQRSSIECLFEFESEKKSLSFREELENCFAAMKQTKRYNFIETWFLIDYYFLISLCLAIHMSYQLVLFDSENVKVYIVIISAEIFSIIIMILLQLIRKRFHFLVFYFGDGKIEFDKKMETFDLFFQGYIFIIIMLTLLCIWLNYFALFGNANIFL